MTETEQHDLGMLIAAATPFLCIHNVRPEPWCRVIKDPKDKRIGPWKYTAEFTVLDGPTWSQKGEVIYFVVDSKNTLRLVGQSKNKLKDRWRLSPMSDAISKQPLGKKALFHTSSWPAIEAGFANNEPPPFIISALFRDKLEPLCKSAKSSLAQQLFKPETDKEKLSYHVESWVCGLDFGSSKLWNKQKVK